MFVFTPEAGRSGSSGVSLIMLSALRLPGSSMIVEASGDARELLLP